HARSAFRHVDYCEDQPERLRDNQRSPEPGVLTPLATWTLLSCLFRLFLRSRSIWSKGSLWGGFWRFRQYNCTFVRNDKSFFFSRVLHKGLIIFFVLEFLPIASQLLQGSYLLSCLSSTAETVLCALRIYSDN